MTHHTDFETLVRAIEPEPSEAEREAVWAAVAARVRERERARIARPWRRRFALRRPLVAAMTGAAAAAATLLVIALLPSGGDAPPPLPANASAATVLRATADAAAEGLPAIGAGEYLYARLETAPVGPSNEPGGAIMVAESWTATDGSGQRVESLRRGDKTREIARVSYEPGVDVGHRVEDGTEVRERPEHGDWRAVVPGREVPELPVTSEALLASLRAGVDEGEFASLVERDLLVTDTAVDLLIEAPLRPEQRAAALEMLADIPAWFTPGTSTRPVHADNRGPTEDSLDRSGIAVRIAIDLTPGLAEHVPGGHEIHYTADLVLDPEGGRLLEVREHEISQVRTVAEQQVVDSLSR